MSLRVIDIDHVVQSISIEKNGVDFNFEYYESTGTWRWRPYEFSYEESDLLNALDILKEVNKRFTVIDGKVCVLVKEVVKEGVVY